MTYEATHNDTLNAIPPDVIAEYLNAAIQAWFFITHQQRDGFSEADMEIGECMRRVSIWCDEQKEKGTWDAIDEPALGV